MNYEPSQDQPPRRLASRPRWWTIAALLLLTMLTVAACVTQVQTPTPAAEAETAATDTVTNTDSVAADPVTAEATEPPSEAVTDTTTTEDDTTSTPLDLIGEAIPGDETYRGIPVGFTENGLPYRGSPDAPLVMIEYSDYQCPFCNRYFVQTEPAFDESYVRSGEVRVVFFDFPLESLHPNAPAAHIAAVCVGAQGSAEQYWEMHAELFRSVEEWQAASDPQPVFERLAETIGVDGEEFAACVSDPGIAELVDARVEEVVGLGLSATPSFHVIRLQDSATFEIIGAQPYDQFESTINAALAGEDPPPLVPEAQQEGQGEIPFWATIEGWQPDPDRPGYNIAGDQYLGNVDALVTVIEFSDFQCPFCRQHVQETKPALQAQYVENGDVLWVFKHFPLSIHPQAPEAGVAAECAGEQGQFWEMHDLLFTTVEAWSIDDPFDIFVGYAGDLGLDDEAFAACLENDEMAARVQSDLDEGSGYVRGTPTFIVIRGNQGIIIPGAIPVDRFSEILDQELAAAGQ